LLNREDLTTVRDLLVRVGISRLELQVNPLATGFPAIIPELDLPVDAVIGIRDRSEDLVCLCRSGEGMSNKQEFLTLGTQSDGGLLVEFLDLALESILPELHLDKVEDLDL